MTSLARTAYRYFVALFLVGVIVQFFLAGLGAFRGQDTTTTSSGFEHHFSAHVTLGHLLVIPAALVFLAALAARMGRRRVLTTLALPLLVELQSVLANSGPDGVRALHPVNGTLILGIAGVLAHRAWTVERAAALASEPAEAALQP